MKRIMNIFGVLIILTALSATAFADSIDNLYLKINAPNKFRAVGIVTDSNDPLSHLQNMIDIEFQDGKESTRTYTVFLDTDSSGNPSEYRLDLNLVYDKELLEGYQIYFINGTFTYTEIKQRDTIRVSGSVKGRIINLATNSIDIDISSEDENVFVIVLDCYSSDYNWGHKFTLSTPNEQLVMLTSEPAVQNSYRDEEAYDYSHEERPHIPSPSRTRDIAAGVGISTAGIVILNSLTNTTVFGSASFNGSFNPNAGPTVQPGVGSGATSGSAASASAAVHGSSAATATQAGSASGSSGFFRIIGNFLRNLWESLRDMLTDEGRAYAGGKITEMLSETDIDNISE